MTDHPQVDEKEKRKKAEPSPAFDPKARGAALRAAFLKAAHPGAEPDGANEETLNQGSVTGTHQKKQGSQEAASNDPKEAEEGEQRQEEQKEIKPQIERELFAEYVVVEDDDDEDEEFQEADEDQDSHVEPEQEPDTETEPEQEPDSDPKPVEDTPAGENLVTDGLSQEGLTTCHDKTPKTKCEQAEEATTDEAVPAPVPIIEEVVATPIDKPEETTDNQVVVKRPKLGFFARLKLLFFGGRTK